MDEYGSFRNVPEDFKEIRAAIEENGSVVFSYSYDNVGAMIILISKNFKKLGIMPFGGNPNERIYVGVYGRGCSHFSTNDIHPEYFDEKLRLGSGDAEGFANLWKGIWNK